MGLLALVAMVGFGLLFLAGGLVALVLRVALHIVLFPVKVLFGLVGIPLLLLFLPLGILAFALSVAAAGVLVGLGLAVLTVIVPLLPILLVVWLVSHLLRRPTVA